MNPALSRLQDDVKPVPFAEIQSINLSCSSRGARVHNAEAVRTPEVLKLDASLEVDRICTVLRDQIFQTLRRKGLVVGLYGGN